MQKNIPEKDKVVIKHEIGTNVCSAEFNRILNEKNAPISFLGGLYHPLRQITDTTR